MDYKGRAFSNIPRCVWIFLSIPMFCLILAFAQFICTYSSVIRNAEETKLTIGSFTVQTKKLQAITKELIIVSSQLLKNNSQEISAMAYLPKDSAGQKGAKLSKEQVEMLMQQQKLQNIQDELQNIEQQNQLIASMQSSKK